MKNSVVYAISTALLAIVFTGCPSEPAPPSEQVMQKPLVVFLVRHAEKVDASKDPELSAEGIERSGALAKLLDSADIGHIHSSDFKRTRDTAGPVAAENGLKVELYDPDDLAALAKKLRETGGRHLVVGHSNTTPELTKLLGGNPGTKIEEKSEYDRVYIVTVGKDGTVNSVLLRYGKAFKKAMEKTAG